MRNNIHQQIVGRTIKKAKQVYIIKMLFIKMAQ